MVGPLLWLSGCSQQSDAPEAAVWPLLKSCELRTSACTAQAPADFSLDPNTQNKAPPQASVTLSINPRPIQVARSLEAKVQLHGFDQTNIHTIEIDVAGINMYMGYNRVTLEPESPGHYTGPLMLAFCTNDKMQWQVTVMVTRKNGQQIQIPFQLIIYNQQSN